MEKHSDKRIAKEGVVVDIKEKFQKAKSVILVDYRGLTVEQDTVLRKELRTAGVEYRVLKNSLVHRATDEIGIHELKSYLVGPTAFAFGYDDPVTPAKILAQYIKKEKKMELKAGLIGQSVFGAAGVQSLADLPPKEVLVAKLLGTLNAPITSFVSVLNGPTRALVYALDSVRRQKEAAQNG